MRLRTLGSLALEGAAFGRRKPLLLLAYLALEGPTARRRLVELFWTDAADGRDSLQTTLGRLRRVSRDLVYSDGDRLGTAVPCDAHAFEEAALSRDGEGALALYCGAFLEDLDLPLDPELEDWVLATRERLALLARGAHASLAEQAVRSRQWASGRVHAERSYALPHGPARSAEELERLAWLLDATESPLALDVRRELEELGVALPDVPGGGLGRRTNLPRFATSFHGRHAELSLIAERLGGPHVRLLTVHGPGGVGKTRLAVESARRQVAENRFPHGVYFVPMEDVSDHDAAVAAVAAAMYVDLSPQVPPEQHVLGAIGDRELLLVLDNFEHLVGASQLPADIVRACPNARVLVTSRRTLNVAEEHVIRLEGLPTTSDFGEPEALRLLGERLEQHALGSRALAGQRRHGLRVCELLEGNPLGIELAAASARYMTLEQLAGELASGFGPLVSRDPRSGARQRSMSASLEVSWHLLDEEHRTALARLSAFRGGFDREAAEVVARAGGGVIESLCDAALVRMGPNGRFDQHPLVHRFAADRLAERPGEERAAREAHASYYLGRAGELGHAVLGGPTARDALTWLETESANIERAWRWAVDAGATELLQAATWALSHLGELRGRYREVIGLLEVAASSLEGKPEALVALGHMLGCLAFLYFRVGAVERSQAAGKRAVEVLQPRRAPSGNWGLWAAYQGLAMSSFSLADRSATKKYLESGIESAERDRDAAGGNPVCERIADVAYGISVQTLAYLATDAGDHDGGIALLERATESFERHGAPYLSYVYWQLGRVHLEVGAAGQARAWLEKGLAFSREIGFHTLVGHTLNHLARVLMSLGDLEGAVRACEHALPHAIDSGDKWLRTSLLAARGMALKAAGDLAGAMAAFHESLEVARSFEGLGFAMEALVGLADPVYHADGLERSAALLSCVCASPLTPEFVAREARAQLLKLSEVVGAEAWREAEARGGAMDLEDALAMALEARLPPPSAPRRDDRSGPSLPPN